jgi:glutamate-1-semialdehyde 2,1-aminomutase
MSVEAVEQRTNDLLEQARVDAVERYRGRTAASRTHFEAACEPLPGGNTRTVIHFDPYPLRIVNAEGARVTDADGHTYLDFLGEYSAGLYGHSDPHIIAAVKRALDNGIVFGGPNLDEIELARILCARFPSVERVRFTNSGTEANLMALGAARARTGRDKVLVFNGAYHGGVLYMAPYAARINVPFDYVYGTYNDLEATLEAARGVEQDIAAILIEPMAGGGGGIVAEPEFLQGLRQLADAHGIIMIFDEVMTSRMGRAGLQGELGVLPDMTTMGKYLGGGLTFGAFGGRADIMELFDPRNPAAVPHAGTFNNNVLSMAAGVAGLTHVFTEDAADELRDRGNALRDRMNGIIAKHGTVAQVMGYGSILTVHFQNSAIRQPKDTARTRPEARALFHMEMLERGFYMAARGYMSLSMALDDADLDGFCGAFDDVLERYGRLFAEADIT